MPLSPSPSTPRVYDVDLHTLETSTIPPFVSVLSPNLPGFHSNLPTLTIRWPPCCLLHRTAVSSGRAGTRAGAVTVSTQRSVAVTWFSQGNGPARAGDLGPFDLDYIKRQKLPDGGAPDQICSGCFTVCLTGVAFWVAHWSLVLGGFYLIE